MGGVLEWLHRGAAGGLAIAHCDANIAHQDFEIAVRSQFCLHVCLLRAVLVNPEDHC